MELGTKAKGMVKSETNDERLIINERWYSFCDKVCN